MPQGWRLFAVGFFLSPATCGCFNPPSAIGWALVVGGATAASWAIRVANRRPEPPAALTALGRLGVIAAVGLGAVRVIDDIARILAI